MAREELVLALHQEVWQRGLVVSERGAECDVYLLDIGQTITVRREDMRVSSPELEQIPPFAFQVRFLGTQYLLTYI